MNRPVRETPPRGILPYRDTKPVGAPDFYFAINATFRFIAARFGIEGLRRYWNDLGEDYYKPVAALWRERGLPGVADYWREFFAAEPGAGSQVAVVEAPDVVTLQVATCPAIHHLRTHGREIVPCFCQHCYFVGEAMSRRAGMTLRVFGGNGACQQHFYAAATDVAPRCLSNIAEAR